MITGDIDDLKLKKILDALSLSEIVSDRLHTENFMLFLIL